MKRMRAQALWNCRPNEPGLILGNGPSLERIDFDRLKTPIVVVGMHRSWRQYNPPFHVILRQTKYFDEIARGDWKPEGFVITRGMPPKKGLPDHIRMVTVFVSHHAHRGAIRPLHVGSNAVFCGHFALEVAVHLGLNPIYLIGYDMHNGQGHAKPLLKNGEEDKISWDSTRQRQREIMTATGEFMKEFYPKVRVFNLNPNSAIKCYPFTDINEVYRG